MLTRAKWQGIAKTAPWIRQGWTPTTILTKTSSDFKYRSIITVSETSVDLAVKLRMADYIPMFANTAYRLTTVDQ
jgi:hypothetical protein